jgi:hypothetical protein
MSNNNYIKSPNLKGLFLFALIGLLLNGCNHHADRSLKLNDLGYFETRGLNVLVFSNWYNGLFSDSKISGVEIIHHGVRTATNGDVRLSPTPVQWDPIPEFTSKKINEKDNTIEAYLKYSKYNFKYEIKAEGRDEGILISVIIDKPLPKELEGVAGFNLEFLPSAYFSRTYMMDQHCDVFPLYPSSAMEVDKAGKIEPKPLASGTNLTLAPEDLSRRVMITSRDGGDLALFDGRNLAQNGWFVVRSIIPSGKSGKVIEWSLSANTISHWVRPPVIEHSQVGYHPNQEKVAVIELDKNEQSLSKARLLKVESNGKFTRIYEAEVKKWGHYLRYNYATFDFTQVKENGLYLVEYENIRTKPFRISTDVYEKAWQPTLDVYFPIAMDHMYVKDAYRVWHGASHLDDALQAPVNHEHFDLYAQGPETDTRFKPGEHIPGLNVGGWYDAGDFDIRTQTVYAVVSGLVSTWETFGIKRDETAIDQQKRRVLLHVPDGKPDLIQQIEHGALQLLAQHKAVGHAINGIIEAHLSQYTHLGDASTKTDNLIYKPGMDSLQTNGINSGAFDDRWAFTNKSSALNYGSIAGLAAASRALKGFNDKLAGECLETAQKVWVEEHSHKPNLYRHGNTTGGPLEVEEVKAALELLICTKDAKYMNRLNELWPSIQKYFRITASMAVRALPYADAAFSKKLESLVKAYKVKLDSFYVQNPFGVPVSTEGWAGNGLVISSAINNYYLHKAFPGIIGAEYVYKGLNYIYGTHPGSDISFVSGVGTESKRVAYGNNRADFTFIAGGIVPGELILKPDFPENKDDWPFLWGENEYVVNLGASYIFLVNAVNELLKK